MSAFQVGRDRGIYPEALQRQIAYALPRLWIATGWVRLEAERRYERRNAATGTAIAVVWCGEEWWAPDAHESDLGTWVHRVYLRSGRQVERPCVSRKVAWENADELLLADEYGQPRWVLAPSTCPICRGAGELLEPYTEADTSRCEYCRGTGEIEGGEG